MINNEKINMFYMTRTSVMCGAMWTRVLRHTYMLDFLASLLEENNSYLFELAHRGRRFTYGGDQ